MKSRNACAWFSTTATASGYQRQTVVDQQFINYLETGGFDISIIGGVVPAQLQNNLEQPNNLLPDIGSPNVLIGRRLYN